MKSSIMQSVGFVVFCIILLLALTFFVIGGSELGDRQDKRKEENKEPCPFVVEEKLPLPNRKYGNMEIWRHKETGIRYLYVWKGGRRGGPAITRLWERDLNLTEPE